MLTSQVHKYKTIQTNAATIYKPFSLTSHSLVQDKKIVSIEIINNDGTIMVGRAKFSKKYTSSTDNEEAI